MTAAPLFMEAVAVVEAVHLLTAALKVRVEMEVFGGLILLLSLLVEPLVELMMEPLVLAVLMAVVTVQVEVGAMTQVLEVTVGQGEFPVAVEGEEDLTTRLAPPQQVGQEAVAR
jgi:hypothetical protein